MTTQQASQTQTKRPWRKPTLTELDLKATETGAGILVDTTVAKSS